MSAHKPGKYSTERLPLVLLAPIVSEKATMVADKLRQIAFRVADDATKGDVKAAVEAMFKEQKVEVANVQILNVKGKPVNKDGIEFWGQSFVCAPNGQVIAKASPDREEVLVVPCDLGAVEFSRTHWPFLRDRRIDAYGDITRRFIDSQQAISPQRRKDRRG